MRIMLTYQRFINGRWYYAGDIVDVPEELGNQIVAEDQGWQLPATKPEPKPRKRKGGDS